MDIERCSAGSSTSVSKGSGVFAFESKENSRFSGLFEEKEETRKTDSDVIPSRNLICSFEEQENEASQVEKSNDFLFEAYEETESNKDSRKFNSQQSLCRNSNAFFPSEVGFSALLDSGRLFNQSDPSGGQGWRCSDCNFFNFESFLNCKRCGKEKVTGLFESYNKPLKGRFATETACVEKKKKPPQRDGDWFCTNCRNLNFSFRVTCNRCRQSKIISGVDCYPRGSGGKKQESS